MKKASGLGRGLGALIPEAASAAGAVRAGALEIPISKIKANAYQPRSTFNQTELEQLAESIREHGVIQPILNTILGQLDTLLLQPVAQLLGLNLGGSDLTQLWLQCDESAVRLSS